CRSDRRSRVAPGRRSRAGLRRVRRAQGAEGPRPWPPGRGPGPERQARHRARRHLDHRRIPTRGHRGPAEGRRRDRCRRRRRRPKHRSSRDHRGSRLSLLRRDRPERPGPRYMSDDEKRHDAADWLASQFGGDDDEQSNAVDEREATDDKTPDAAGGSTGSTEAPSPPAPWRAAVPPSATEPPSRFELSTPPATTPIPPAPVTPPTVPPSSPAPTTPAARTP